MPPTLTERVIFLIRRCRRCCLAPPSAAKLHFCFGSIGKERFEHASFHFVPIIFISGMKYFVVVNVADHPFKSRATICLPPPIAATCSDQPFKPFVSVLSLLQHALRFYSSHHHLFGFKILISLYFVLSELFIHVNMLYNIVFVFLISWVKFIFSLLTWNKIFLLSQILIYFSSQTLKINQYIIILTKKC